VIHRRRRRPIEVHEGSDATCTVTDSDATLAPGQSALVTTQTNSGTATENKGFDSCDGTVLTFVVVGATSQTLTVHADTDMAVEGAENYSVQITNPTVGTGMAVTDIHDLSAGPPWNIARDGQVNEGSIANSTARTVANRIIFIDRGEIIEENAPEAFFNSPRSERTWLFLSQILLLNAL
jgi:hypothetical protein